MPFLVGSLTAALRDRGARVDSEAHPVLTVVGDEAGKIAQVPLAGRGARASVRPCVRRGWA